MAGPHAKSGYRRAGRSAGPAWAWPLFLGGIAALVAAVLMGKLELIGPPSAQRLLTQGREALDQNKPEVAISLASQVAETDPRLTASASLLVARAMLIQAASQSEVLAVTTAQAAGKKLQGVAEDQLANDELPLLQIARGRISLITKLNVAEEIARLKTLP